MKNKKIKKYIFIIDPHIRLSAYIPVLISDIAVADWY